MCSTIYVMELKLNDNAPTNINRYLTLRYTE